MRVVLDTNIIVSACLTPQGAPATTLELALIGQFELCLTEEVLEEYREVLARPKFRREQERAGILLAGIRDAALMVRSQSLVQICRDAGDNRLLECAVAGRADFIVSGNLRHFPERFGKARVVNARGFLEEIGF